MTKIAQVSNFTTKDNLLILADEGHFEWVDTFFDSFLTEDEVTFLKQTSEAKTPFALIPRAKNVIIVQFLKSYDTLTTRMEKARRAGDHLLELIKHHKLKEVTIVNRAELNSSIQIAEGIALGNYQFLKYYKDADQRASSLKKIKIHKESANRAEIKELSITVDAVSVARDLVNEPLSYLTAPQLAKTIQVLGKESGCKVQVFNKKKIEQLKMGGLLAVNLGSPDPPTFSIMEWKPKKAFNTRPIVLVGKGVVYDTGGLSLKPTTNSMDFMKCDMGGAAAVIGATYALAKSKIPLHIITLVPATDNRPGQNAYVPGDVIHMHNGSTVEVMNTDAEGRMLLADALSYAKKYKPELVLDFATLTGAAARAIGTFGVVYMGNAMEQIKWQFEESGETVSERLVEFPLWDEYAEMLKSDIADLKNLGGPMGGAMTAGKFLEHFTDYPWLHFDIAGAAFIHHRDSYRGKNGTGVGVRLIVDFFKNYTYM